MPAALLPVALEMAHQDLDPKGRWTGTTATEVPEFSAEGLRLPNNSTHLILLNSARTARKTFDCFQLLIPTPT